MPSLSETSFFKTYFNIIFPSLTCQPVLGNVKIVLEPAVYTFVYQRFLRVLASISGHSQGAFVVVTASLCVYKWSIVGCTLLQIISSVIVKNTKTVKAINVITVP